MAIAIRGNAELLLFLLPRSLLPLLMMGDENTNFVYVCHSLALLVMLVFPFLFSNMQWNDVSSNISYR